MHVQISTLEYDEKIEQKIEPFIFEYTSKLKGSVSAEHGIGFKKTKYLKYSKDSTAINLMKNLKCNMDPNNILNPYKVLYPL